MSCVVGGVDLRGQDALAPAGYDLMINNMGDGGGSWVEIV